MLDDRGLGDLFQPKRFCDPLSLEQGYAACQTILEYQQKWKKTEPTQAMASHAGSLYLLNSQMSNDFVSCSPLCYSLSVFTFFFFSPTLSVLHFKTLLTVSWMALFRMPSSC